MDRNTKLHGIALLKSVLAPLSRFLDLKDVTEVMVNGPNNVWVERHGRRPERVEVEFGDIDIRAAIQAVARLNNKEAKEGSHLSVVDAQFENCRFNGILSPPAVNGPTICIRKHGEMMMSLDQYVSQGGMTLDTAGILGRLIRTRKNIIVAGSTGSGKTTLVNALLAEADPAERFFTIEDVAELKIVAPNHVAYIADPQAGVPAEALLKAALRNRPDRIILGEVRDATAYELLNAANTGHDGCVATLHANSASDALLRFENMVLQRGIPYPLAALRYQIAAAFDAILFIRKEPDGRRVLHELAEICAYNRREDRYDLAFHADCAPATVPKTPMRIAA